MIDWIIDNKEWIFSGFGVFVVSGFVWLIRYVLSRRKSSETHRIINLNGEKSLYIEKNEGEININ